MSPRETGAPADVPARAPREITAAASGELVPRPAGRRHRVSPRLRPWLRTLAAFALLAVLVARFDARTVADALQAVDGGTVLAALGLGLLSTVASAGRWWLVARNLGVRLPLRAAVVDTYRAAFLNSVLPAGVLGDVHRAVAHGRDSGARAARAVVLERVAGQLAVVVVGTVVVLWHPALLATLAGLARGVLAGGGATAAALVALGTAVVVAGPLRSRGAALGARCRAIVRTCLADAREGVAARAVWPGVVGLSVVALGGYLALFVLAARAAGVDEPVGVLLPLLMLGLLAMALPLNVGGWGPREGVTAVAFAAVGLGAGQGLATAVVYGVLSLVACLPGAALLLRRPAGRPRSDRTVPARVVVARGERSQR